MPAIPQSGEVWFVDLGMVGKPRYALVLAARTDARLALASVVLITTHFEETPYEVVLPRVPWLREQSYINAQSIQRMKRGALLINTARGGLHNETALITALQNNVI